MAYTRAEPCSCLPSRSGMELPERIRGALNRAVVRNYQNRSGPPRTQREDLVDWVHAHLHNRKFVVVSNREPYSHVREEGKVHWVRNAGGLTVALDAVARAVG